MPLTGPRAKSTKSKHVSQVAVGDLIKFTHYEARNHRAHTEWLAVTSINHRGTLTDFFHRDAGSKRTRTCRLGTFVEVATALREETTNAE